jgi:hypothetical protein
MTVNPARIATAQTLLAGLGVTVADLRRAQRPAVPTVAEYVPRVLTGAGRARDGRTVRTVTAWPSPGPVGRWTPGRSHAV